MNHIPLINLKLVEFQKEFPKYTMGEIFYAIFSRRNKGKDFKKSEFLEMSDKEFYECTCQAFDHEKEIKE